MTSFFGARFEGSSLAKSVLSGLLVLFSTVIVRADNDKTAPTRNAEPEDLRPSLNLLDRSYVLFGAPGQVLEAQLAPHLLVYRNELSLRDQYFGGFHWAAFVTPMIRLRILSSQSVPVRTPSFMPKLTLQFTWLRKREPGSQWGVRSGTRVPVTRNILEVVPYGHHSNGQDGCMWAPGLEDGTSECNQRYDPQNVRLNYKDGSFSTNYFRVSYERQRLFFNEDRLVSNLSSVTHERAGSTRISNDLIGASGTETFALSYEQHARFLGFGVIGNLDALGPLYGPMRLRATYEREWFRRRGHVRASTWVEYNNKRRRSNDCGLPGQDPCSGHYGMSAEVAYNPVQLKDLSLFTRLYYGQDYYNVRFTQRLNGALQVGLAFDVGRRRPPALPVFTQSFLDSEPRRGGHPPATTSLTEERFQRQTLRALGAYERKGFRRLNYHVRPAAEKAAESVATTALAKDGVEIGVFINADPARRTSAEDPAAEQFADELVSLLKEAALRLKATGVVGRNRGLHAEVYRIQWNDLEPGGDQIALAPVQIVTGSDPDRATSAIATRLAELLAVMSAAPRSRSGASEAETVEVVHDTAVLSNLIEYAGRAGVDQSRFIAIQLDGLPDFDRDGRVRWLPTR